uniref:Uncharacterized protein n=1 Tax=viral metagenome TaxID=1070528 RepID=A0A6M3KKJ4_9ZZZZ
MSWFTDIFSGGGGAAADALAPVDLGTSGSLIESTDWWTDPSVLSTSTDMNSLFDLPTQVGLYGDPVLDLGFDPLDPLAPLGQGSWDWFPDAPSVSPYLNLGFDYENPLTSGINPYVSYLDPVTAQYGPIQTDIFSGTQNWFPTSGYTTASGLRVPSLSGGYNVPQSFDTRYAAAGMPQGVPYDYANPPTGFLSPAGSSLGSGSTSTSDSGGLSASDLAKLAASIATLGGAITGLLANMDAADYADELAELNRQAAEREMAAARRQAADEEEKLRNRTDRLLGRQRALYTGVSGVRMSGSPLDVMTDTENMANKDIEAIRAYGELGVRQAETAGRIASLEGRAYRTASNWNAAGSLLTGLANAGRSLSELF